MEKAKSRAKLNDSSVIDARSLTQSHRRLAELLKPGMSVLDVGCGTGAITSGIAEAVGPTGKVIGIDNDIDLITIARQRYQDIPSLSFETADIYDLPYENQFDIVTSARVLQWLAHPEQALENLVKIAKSGGIVIVLDYNHEKINWQPEVPASMHYFYEKFLEWRADAAMDNSIADHLAAMFEKSGLTQIQVFPQHEKVQRNEEGFETATSIWSGVVSTKGAQMLADGIIDKKAVEEASIEYQKWREEKAEKQQMYLLAVEGRKI
ncbi:methyltransferase domain-containing protein [Gracilibacillus kekensis]|uniref:Ubiquinone/menaquinone biosynthesis C-methylase UbiE n=1 Tax=Gracilibacillus kekensis TaxID=1027249 RepID=A0A1M7IW06_9BACI|nr:methyltransferase domain-containing protein [Gracilibacillus kekensis]SHM44886.1 Ubiquinone/menaquinone biosynthesis C-methylase UbiE [Gracilibacillus kekensis]